MSLTKRKNNTSLLEDFFSRSLSFPTGLIDLENDLFRNWDGLQIPSCNIEEKVNEFSVELAAPGLDKKDFKIHVEDGNLVIRAEKEKETKEEKKNYTKKEFSYNSFYRSFRLPENSDPEKIDASYEKGILSVAIPKKEKSIAAPKKEIKVS